MSHKLAELLGNNHPLFTYNLSVLEKAAGDSGVDTRLIADCTEKAQHVMRVIGVDPADTSDEELYHALNALAIRGKAENVLRGLHYVLLNIGGHVISFCPYDVIENAHHHLPFEDRKVDHAQRYLRAEIIKRYAEHDRTDNELVHKLADEAGLKPVSDSGYKAIDQLLLTAGKTPDTGTPTILAIGDIFTDAFIQLGDDTAKIIKDNDGEWLAVPFGRKPPYERVDIVKSVGPSPNVAVSIARLGQNASLMAWVGDDETGKEAIGHLKSENVSTSSMITENGKNTSYWYVLCYKADRTMLVKSEKYAYEWRDPEQKPDWIYLAYTGEDSWPLHEGLLDYLERNKDVKFAFQPGTFQFKWGPEKLAGIYNRSDMVLMNREEAMEVTGKGHDSIIELAHGLHELGPEIVVITDGPNGSYAGDGSRVLTIPNYPDPAPPVERTGAGDAFSSTFVAAIADGEEIETALLWSPINSMNVVQHIGAQKGLLTREEIQHWLDKAPEDYKVSEVNE